MGNKNGTSNGQGPSTVGRMAWMLGATLRSGMTAPTPRLPGFSRLLRVRLPLGKVRRPMARQEPQARKSNRAAAVDVDRFREADGTGQDWARQVYGTYYATSVPVYAAVRVAARRWPVRPSWCTVPRP